MSIRYITTGNELAAKGLLGEGRHQLSILKNAMSFQKLRQLRRDVRFDDGTRISCSSCFEQDVINVFVPQILPRKKKKKKKKIEEFCWCTDYFTVGIITKIFGDYGKVGKYKGEIYPDYCNSDDTAIKNYNGIRYEVSLCQGTKNSKYICLPSDFAEYEVDDKVIIFMRGIWKGENLNLNPKNRTPEKSCVNNPMNTCIACEGNRRPNCGSDEADGSFLIAPLKI